MRYLINTALFLAAVLMYVFGVGPAFFGAPLWGGALLLGGLVLETGFWHRLRRVPSRSSPGAAAGR